MPLEILSNVFEHSHVRVDRVAQLLVERPDDAAPRWPHMYNVLLLRLHRHDFHSTEFI
jgi:hypothetical protein